MLCIGVTVDYLAVIIFTWEISHIVSAFRVPYLEVIVTGVMTESLVERSG